MSDWDIVRRRWLNHRLAGTAFDKPEDVVKQLVAVQAQEYAGAKWSLAQRTSGVTDAAVDQAFADGKLLRTHLLRPTWHFVDPADIRWILALTAPHVQRLNALYYRKTGLDEAVLSRSADIMIKTLEGGRQRTRTELAAEFRRAGFTTGADDPLRLGYIMMHAELEGIICSGGLHGKQQTYALLEERAPQARTLDRAEALAELILRFFNSRGPATLQDFTKWSGLTQSEARIGLETVRSELAQEVFDGRTYWSPVNFPPSIAGPLTARLLPTYDEYIIGYKDHRGAVDPSYVERVVSRNGQTILIDGLAAGAWKRTLKKSTVLVEVYLFRALNKAEASAIDITVEQFGNFLGKPAVLQKVLGV